MALLCISAFALHHLHAPSRTAYQRLRILPQSTRAISVHQSRTPRTPSVPPAPRRFEHAPPNPPPPKPKPKPNSASASASASVSQPHKSKHERATTTERRPTNQQIPFDHVFVVDPQTNKLSETKQSLESLLATRARHVVELVASSPEPVVRLTTRSEIEARYREIRRALKKGAKVGEESKEVHLSWGVAQADLEHKMRKAKRDLEKDYRVVVLVKMKRGRRPSNQQELAVFADGISEALREVGVEWKEREFSGRSMILSFRKINQNDDSP